MNALIVGTNKNPVLEYLPETFLLIDDGPLIDTLKIPPRIPETVHYFSKNYRAFQKCVRQTVIGREFLPVWLTCLAKFVSNPCTS